MNRRLLAAELALAEKRQPYARVTVIWSSGLTSGKVGNQALVTVDGTMTGWIGGACSREQVIRHCQEALVAAEPRVLQLGEAKLFAVEADGHVREPITCASEGALELFIEPRLPATQLVVVGDSPLARTLCRLGRAMNYEVTAVLLEDTERDDADRIVRHITPNALKPIVDESSFVVVATMGQYDEEAVYGALKTAAPYVALVASQRRSATVRGFIEARGDVCGGRLRKLRAPAGLDLGAIPHEEIAVAVLAEVVAEKATGVGVPTIRLEQREESIDPVCGMRVDVGSARYTLLLDGETHYFCCAGCRDKYEQDPTRWAS